MTRTTIIRIAALAIIAASAAGGVLAHSSSTPVKTAFDAVLVPYEAIHRALAADSLEGVAENAKAIRDTVRTIGQSFDAARAGVSQEKAAQCRAILPKVEAAAARLAKATTLQAAREAFGELSWPMVQWREMATGDRPYVVFCPMAKKPWLQEADQVANPYFGSKMLKCGNIVSN